MKVDLKYALPFAMPFALVALTRAVWWVSGAPYHGAFAAFVAFMSTIMGLVIGAAITAIMIEEGKSLNITIGRRDD